MLMRDRIGLGFDVNEALAKLKAEGQGLPPHTYTSSDVFELENKELFSKSWTCFAPIENLREPGSVVVGNVGRIPVIVTRSADGKVHGFINACRHRGYPVAQANGSGCKKLTCPYHSWSYRLDGSLIVAPETGDAFDKAEHGLLPVSVETWAQFVFVNPDPMAKPLLESLVGLEDVANRFNMLTGADDYELVEVVEVHQGANWKLWFDNNTECYHCPTIHSSSFADAFETSADAYTLETHGQFTATAILPKQKDGNDRPSTTIHMHPGAFVVQQKDIMVMARIVPQNEKSYTVFTYYFAEKGADPQSVADWLKIWKQTFDEDKHAIELQQIGLESGQTKPFRYVEAREAQPMHHAANTLLAYQRSISGGA